MTNTQSTTIDLSGFTVELVTTFEVEPNVSIEGCLAVVHHDLEVLPPLESINAVRDIDAAFVKAGARKFEPLATFPKPVIRLSQHDWNRLAKRA